VFRLTGGSDGERHDGDPTGSGRVRARETTPGERGRQLGVQTQ
jgi:hypothetical protein